MISHYATGGPGQHLLPGLEEATSDDKSPVLVFILTVNNDWSQVHQRSHGIITGINGPGISSKGTTHYGNLANNLTCLEYNFIVLIYIVINLI